MKIHLLPIGAQFEWNGKVYTKIGPMTANTEKGGTVFVPKHAALKPVGGTTQAAAPPPDTVALTDVMAAFDLYHQHARQLVAVDQLHMLESAREHFLASLDNR